MSSSPRVAAARLDRGTNDDGCGILHVDLDAFFALVELAREPRLRGRPLIVGGGDRGVVLSATYEARAFGVKAAMPVAQARRLCPAARIVPPRPDDYRRISEGVMGILHEVTAIVEQVSVDEAYLDVTGARRRLGPPVAIAEWIRERVERTYGVTCSVGVATSKLVAKLASTQAKPDGVLLVPRGTEVSFLHMLPVGAILGVGARTQESLARRGIKTVAELAQTDPAALAQWLGAQGRHLYDLAWGRDHRPVEPAREERSVGAESTFAVDARDPAVIDARLVALADRCASRARGKSLVGRTVIVKVRTADFVTVTRSRTLRAPTDSAHEILAVARSLYDSVALRGRAVRLIGVRLESVEPRLGIGVQVSLDEALLGTAEDLRTTEGVMDEVRARFGSSSIGAGTTMSGVAADDPSVRRGI